MTTSMTRFNEMLNAYDEIQKIIKRVETKAINNVAISKMYGIDNVIATLNNNGISTTDRTAKQVRRAIKYWFNRFEVSKFSVEANLNGEWQETYFSDNEEQITMLAELSLQNGYEVRIKNNLNGCLSYKQGNNWIDFPKA